VQAPLFAVTFEPHPLKLLAPERYQPPLTTIDDRAELLHQVGADGVIVLETTPGLLALGAEAFCETVLRTALEARGIVEGFNFRFGHQRDGSNETLEAFCQQIGIPFRVVSAFELEGIPVSSSRVRQAIEEGNLDESKRLLSYDYFLRGIVIEGAKRGRTIGFPTANLGEIETLLPADGVYGVKVELPDGKRYLGAANIGPNPTFGEGARKIEIHLLDFRGDLYGTELKVEFISRLRNTVPFSSVDALIQRLNQDIAEVRTLEPPHAG
jgi:riboflavin kinase/FMN adenylyltransferase